MLFIVDHLHIQYNGFLLGILLISLSCLEEGRDLMGGLVFAVLLCFKHLFVVYFVYLLRHYCWKGLVRGFWLLSVLGAVVVAGCFYIGIWPVCVSWADASSYPSHVSFWQANLRCLLGGHQIFWCSISY